MFSPRLLSATVLAAVLCSPLCEAQWFGALGVEGSYIDNLTRSELSRDAREDHALTMTARGGLHTQPGIYTSLDFTGNFNRTQYRQYTGLSNSEAGLTLTLAHKFGLGDRQPTLSLDLGVARNEFNQDFRDAWIQRAGISLQKRITDTFNISSGLRYEKRDGDHDIPRNIPQFPRPGSSWDVAGRSLFVTAELDLGPSTWVSTMYQVQDGTIVSTALPYPKIFDTATAITLDPSFGPLAVAYRIPAITHTLAVDLNQAVFSAGTLYAGIEYQETHGKNGIDYDSGLIRCGFIHSF
jgi:hypothetical protein